MTSIHNLATTYDMLGRYDHAEPLYLEALEGKTRVLGASHPTRILTVVRLAAMYERNRRFAESEALLMGVVQTLGLDRMTGDAGKSAPFRVLGAAVNIVAQIAQLYDAWGKPVKAAEWRAKLPKDPAAKAASR